MHKIKFSHRYYKMPSVLKTSTLYQLFICDSSELSKDFRGYDVSYENEHGDCEEYPLPKGKLIVLLISTVVNSKEYLWTTIRRWTPQKETYYRSILGDEVDIVINETKENI